MSKDVEQKAVGVADDVEQKEKDVMGTLTKTSYFGNKKLKGKKIEVKDGDTLWGIARKFNVSTLCFLIFLSYCHCDLYILPLAHFRCSCTGC